MQCKHHSLKFVNEYVSYSQMLIMGKTEAYFLTNATTIPQSNNCLALHNYTDVVSMLRKIISLS